MRPAWVSPPRGAPLTRTSPTAQLASSGRRGPEPAPGKSRRPAEARPGPELPFPPARRRASAAAEPGPPRPPTPGSPPTRAAPSAHGSLAGTQRAACGDTEGERGVYRPSPGAGAQAGAPTPSARLGPGGRAGQRGRPGKGGLPPAAAPSAGSLLPPPPPSQLCRRRRCRKRRRRNRLTSPPDYAGAAQADRSDKSDLWKESGPARPASRAPRAGGGGATASRRARASPRAPSDAPCAPTCGFPVLRLCSQRSGGPFLHHHLSQGRGSSESLGEMGCPLGGAGGRTLPPGRFRAGFPSFAPALRPGKVPARLHLARAGSPRNLDHFFCYVFFFTFSPASPALPEGSRSVLAGRHVGGPRLA